MAGHRVAQPGLPDPKLTPVCGPCCLLLPRRLLSLPGKLHCWGQRSGTPPKDKQGRARHSLTVCPLSRLEQAPGKTGSSPEPTELVYILGGSFQAVCSLPLHLPPSFSSLLLPWGGGMEMAARRRNRLPLCWHRPPAMRKPTDEEWGR